MRKLTFNQDGEAIDEATGDIIGKRDSSGKIIFNQEKMKMINDLSSTDKPKEEDKHEDQKPPEEKKSAESFKTQKYTKYEITKDSEFTVKFCLGFEDGKILVYKEDSYLRIDNLERHWVTFRMWSFKEELEMKGQCLEFDQIARSFRQNNNKLNELKIKKLIKSWSFSNADPKFKLLHVDGVLSDESYDIMMGMNPQILNNIIILMNNVLE